MTGENTVIAVPEDVQENWRQIVDILAQVCGVPAALIMRLNHPDIEVFIAARSEGNPYHEGDREAIADSGLYCETVIRDKQKLLVPDALVDAKWRDNPDIKLNMISYLGFPILLPDGHPFGTICVLDSKRNEYSQLIEQLMLQFKDIIESSLELIYMNYVLGDEHRRLTDYVTEIQTLRGLVAICANCRAIKDEEGHWIPIERYLLKHPEADFSHGICPECMKRLYPDFDDGS